jgi:hypothetical protein
MKRDNSRRDLYCAYRSGRKDSRSSKSEAWYHSQSGRMKLGQYAKSCFIIRTQGSQKVPVLRQALSSEGRRTMVFDPAPLPVSEA